MRLYILFSSLLFCLVACDDTGDEDGTDGNSDSTEEGAGDGDAEGDDTTAAVSGGSDSGASDDCVQRGEPQVQCGEEICQGSTPLCCMAYISYASGNMDYKGCVDSLQSCYDIGREEVPEDEPWLDLSNYIASACEDAADCPQGEVCCNQYNKGLGRNEGSTCETNCDVFMYGHQLCTQSCECLDGLTCEMSDDSGWGYCQ